MAVVRDYYIGNTHIIVDDEYCIPKEQALKELEENITPWLKESLARAEYSRRGKNNG